MIIVTYRRHRLWKKTIVVKCITQSCLDNLTLVAHTQNTTRLTPHSAQRGHQYPHQKRYDRYDNQKLNEGEPPTRPPSQSELMPQNTRFFSRSWAHLITFKGYCYTNTLFHYINGARHCQKKVKKNLQAGT